jgi:ABC-2 type transport system ATP-binding protein
MASELKILDIHDVSVSYGKKIAIENIAFHVNRGECFGLIGLNGAGKTTLIKTILALRDTSSGHVLIDGLDNASPTARATFSYLPEKFDPPWYLSGLEFIDFTLKLYRQKVSFEDIETLSNKLGLETSALKNRVKTYSKGMRQKIGIIATFLSGTDLIILDEPMSGLDPLTRVCVKDLIIQAKKNGQTIFFSSHILADVNEICDRVSVIHHGQDKFTGTPAALMKNWKNDNLERAFLNLVKEG